MCSENWPPVIADLRSAGDERVIADLRSAGKKIKKEKKRYVAKKKRIATKKYLCSENGFPQELNEKRKELLRSKRENSCY